MNPEPSHVSTVTSLTSEPSTPSALPLHPKNETHHQSIQPGPPLFHVGLTLCSVLRSVLRAQGRLNTPVMPAMSTVNLSGLRAPSLRYGPIARTRSHTPVMHSKDERVGC
eukprot:827660-Rhodomonas_salina.2